MKLLTLIVAFSVYQTICAYRILGIYPHPGSSHFMVFQPFLQRLSEVGHEVTVISHFPLKPPVKNYRDISLFGTLPIWKSVFHFDNFTFTSPMARIVRHTNSANVLVSMGNKACHAMLENNEVKDLKQGQFDLILVEDFNSDCSMGIVYKLKLPFIALTSHVMMSWTMDNLGLINNPSYVAAHYLGHGRELNALEATESFLVSNYYKWYFYFFSQIPEREIVKKYLGEDLPPLETIARNVSMILTNTYFPLTGANPVPPNVVEIGGIYHKEPKALPKDIKQFLDDALHGVILFSMGSMLKAITLPEDKLKAFQEVFAELPQKVLWKWENDGMPGVPENVKLVKWIPQYDILHHKNVKAFITHAGMLGLSETVKCGVPALTIPMYGDQFSNAAALEESGGGIYMDYMNITKESLRWAMKAILDPKLKQGARRLSSLWNDRPKSAMETAVYWIEHVARHGGKHLQPPSKDLPLYRYLMLDVFAILTILILVACCVLYKIFAICLAVILQLIGEKNKKD